MFKCTKSNIKYFKIQLNFTEVHGNAVSVN